MGVFYLALPYLFLKRTIPCSLFHIIQGAIIIFHSIKIYNNLTSVLNNKRKQNERFT